MSERKSPTRPTETELWERTLLPANWQRQSMRAQTSTWGWGNAQWLRELAVLIDNPGLVSSTHVAASDHL